MATQNPNPEPISHYLGRPLLPESIHKGDGMLTDKQIREALVAGMLLRNSTPDNAKYTSYELRIGRRLVTLVPDDEVPSEDRYEEKSKTLGEGEVFTIRPGQTMKLFAQETVDIPANIMAIVFPVGSFYRLGLLPETTFADPGFVGEFWVVVSNYSSRVVDLKVGNPLARMQFIKLSSMPDKLHPGSGQVRPPPTSPRRLERPDLSSLTCNDEAGLLKLLSSVSDKVDPPHYEHAFITGAIRQYSVGRIQHLENSLKHLRRLAVVFCFLLAVCAIFLSAPGWAYAWTCLPENFRKLFTEEVIKWLVGGPIALLVLVGAFCRKWAMTKIINPVFSWFGLIDLN